MYTCTYLLYKNFEDSDQKWIFINFKSCSKKQAKDHSTQSLAKFRQKSKCIYMYLCSVETLNGFQSKLDL